MSLDISCVNKIKLEEYAEFCKSFFSNVYDTAASLVKEIISENENCKNAGDGMQYAEKNSICNIIAFVGKRGMGKSSAMLSFAYSLNENPNKYGKNFYLLPKIDMSMATCNESLLDMILAYMWSDYEKISTKSMTRNSSTADLRMKFADVKDSYVRFKRMGNSGYDDEIYSAKELKKLAKSLQLRESFTHLVEEFLAQKISNTSIAADDKYLVVVVDDLDLVSHNPGEVLEQIKNFLSIPKVIVLATLDIERGILNKTSELDKQFSRAHSFIDDSDNVLEYAIDYMAKVIPSNRRIYMPNIHEMKDEYKIDLAEYGTTIGWEKEYPQEVDYIQYCNLLLYKHMGILMDPKIGCIFDEKESLREIVNGLNELYSSLKKENSNGEDVAKAWVEKEIEVLGEKINNKELKNLYSNSSKYSRDRFAEFMVQSIYYFAKTKDYIYEYEFDSVRKDYENYLARITYDKLLTFYVTMRRKLYINDWNAIKNTLWVYSLKYQKGDVSCILSHCIGEALEMIIEKETTLPKLFDVTIADIRKKGIDLSKDDYKTLTDLIKSTMFIDIGNLTNKKIVVTSSGAGLEITEQGDVAPRTNTERISLRIENLITKISFDNFLDNMLHYSQRCERVIGWILSEINIDNVAVVKTLKRALKVEGWEMWNGKYQINSMIQLFPIESLGYMVGLAERLDSNLREKHTASFLVIYTTVRETIFNYMKECEEYYFINKESALRSEAWRELLDIVNIEGISAARLDGLVNYAYKLEVRVSEPTM